MFILPWGLQNNLIQLGKEDPTENATGIVLNLSIFGKTRCVMMEDNRFDIQGFMGEGSGGAHQGQFSVFCDVWTVVAGSWTHPKAPPLPHLGLRLPVTQNTHLWSLHVAAWFPENQEDVVSPFRI